MGGEEEGGGGRRGGGGTTIDNDSEPKEGHRLIFSRVFLEMENSYETRERQG